MNNQQSQQNNNFRFRRNFQIKASQVRLIDSNGDNLGVVSFHEAINKAKEQNLDLIEINSKSFPIVVKIADYGKMLYEQKKQQAEQKKKQQISEVKELTIRPCTDTHDLDHKINQCKDFLAEGHRVKMQVKFRGRELSHPEIGKEKLQYIVDNLQDLIVPVNVSSLILEGKIISLLLSPPSKKG